MSLPIALQKILKERAAKGAVVAKPLPEKEKGLITTFVSSEGRVVRIQNGKEKRWTILPQHEL